MSPNQFDRIPYEMRQYRQFVVWRFEHRNGSDKPTKVPYSPVSRLHANVTDPATWSGFEEAVAAFQTGGVDGIGFVFTAADPFSGIDLDDCEGDQEKQASQVEIFNKFDSYTELSPSGRGLHIIVKGSVPTGRRRAKVEVYSSDRYFTMTGNVYRDAPISDRQELLTVLWGEMASGSSPDFDASAHFTPATETDEAIFRRASAAVNGDKFLGLWNGSTLETPGDGSPSAFDQALVNILAFYTKDPKQIERLWLASPQGQREKTQERADYRRTTINRAFDREVPQLDFSGLRDQLRKLNGQTPPTVGSPSMETALPVVAASAFAGRLPPPRPWHVQGMIPGRTVTLLSGDGGTGKSLVALQLAFATPAGRIWLGSAVRAGRCLFLTAEDDLDEVHRRLVDIANAAGLGLEGLHSLTVSSLAGLDALLAVPDRRSGLLEPTKVFGALWAFAAAQRPALIVLDTLADLFGGEENNRAQARQFIGMLRKLALEFDLAVLLLAHPSLTGLNSGSGTSGSTGWNNSVRSRLYLRRDEADPNARILTTMKSNYGATGQELRLRWQSGVFVEVGRTSNEPAHRAAAEQAADELFLQLLAEFTSQGRTVSPHAASRMNASHLFAKTAAGRQFKRAGFDAAMQRLFEARRIQVVQVGYASKRKDIIAAAGNAIPQTSDLLADRILSGADLPSDTSSDLPADQF